MIPIPQLYTPLGYCVAGIILMLIAIRVLYIGLLNPPMSRMRIISGLAGYPFAVCGFVFILIAIASKQ